MASKTDILNRAFGRIGVDRTTDYSDDNPRAEAARDVYTPVKEETLSAFPWAFAIKRVTLTAIVDTPDFGWTYYLQRPTDMLYAIDEDNETSFAEEGDKMVSDSDTLKLRYVSKDVLEARFSPLYVKLLAINLAIELTYKFENKLEARTQLLIEKQDIEDEARHAISMSGDPENYEVSEFITVRF